MSGNTKYIAQVLLHRWNDIGHGSKSHIFSVIKERHPTLTVECEAMMRWLDTQTEYRVSRPIWTWVEINAMAIIIEVTEREK